MSDTQKKLPDTQWHISYAKKRKNDPRRDKRKCRFKVDDICLNRKSPSYELRCGSSSHCKFYNELRPDENPRKQKNKKTKPLKASKQELIKGLYKNDCFWINLKGTCTRRKRGCTGSVNCELYVNRSQYIRENANN